MTTSEPTFPISDDASVKTRSLVRKEPRDLVSGVGNRDDLSATPERGCNKDGGHAQQSLFHYLVVFLRLGDLYLREKVYGHEDRELLSFSDKL